MSSSSEVEIKILEEVTTYDTPEATGDFLTMRFAEEGMDGSPDAQPSPEVRADRMSGGTKVLTTDSGGTIGGLFLRDDANDLLIEMVMKGTLIAAASTTADTITIDATAKTLTFSTQDPSAIFAVGDLGVLTGFSNSNNNAVFSVANVTTSVITYLGGDLMADEAGSGDEVATLPENISIGKVKRSVSIEKTFTDLTDVNIDYTGQRVDGVEFIQQFGDYSFINFTMTGASWDNPAAGDEMTDGRTIVSASTNPHLASVSDLELLLIGGTIPACGFSSITVGLANNNTRQDDIRKQTACDQVAGQATITVSATAEFSDTNKSFLASKLTMNEVAFYTAQRDPDTGRGYALRLPAVELTTPDPASGGNNDKTSLELTGEAKIGPNSENALTVYFL